MIFWSFWASWVAYAPRGLKIASRLLKDGLLEPIWIQHRPKLAQVGPTLAPRWLQLGSSWGHVGLRSGSPAAPEPTQTFQIPSRSLPKPFKNPFKRLLPVHQAWAAGFGALEVPFGPPKPPTLDPKTARHGSKKDLPRLQILSAQARCLGRSLFIYDTCAWTRN